MSASLRRPSSTGPNRSGLQSLQRGTLWQRLCASTEHALACGALQPINTESHWIEDGGIRFLVRILSSIARKQLVRAEEAARLHPREANPFLPYETDLFVADLSPTHVALLNKFNVVPHHLLIITRRFEEQRAALSQRDFEALWRCMREYDSLGFYNSASAAGASQRHKHLQLVPLPLTTEGPDLPLGPLVEQSDLTNGPGTCPGLPFAHAMVQVDGSWLQYPKKGGAAALAAYQALLRDLGLHPAEDGTLPPYNLLVTSEWMLMVPRAQEAFDGVSVNALGFAGALLVRDEAQLQKISNIGPLSLLRHVALPS